MAEHIQYFECVYLDVDLLSVTNPDTELGEYIGVELNPGDTVSLRCHNCPLRYGGKIGKFTTIIVANVTDPEMECTRLERSEPDGA